MGRALLVFTFLFFANSGKVAAQLYLKPSADSTIPVLNIKVLPQNFYNQQLSFSCKKEVQLQKLTRLPVYIRLGSKEYVDYLEKKPNAVKN